MWLLNAANSRVLPSDTHRMYILIFFFVLFVVTLMPSIIIGIIGLAQARRGITNRALFAHTIVIAMPGLLGAVVVVLFGSSGLWLTVATTIFELIFLGAIAGGIVVIVQSRRLQRGEQVKFPSLGLWLSSLYSVGIFITLFSNITEFGVSEIWFFTPIAVYLLATLWNSYRVWRVSRILRAESSAQSETASIPGYPSAPNFPDSF